MTVATHGHIQERIDDVLLPDGHPLVQAHFDEMREKAIFETEPVPPSPPQNSPERLADVTIVENTPVCIGCTSENPCPACKPVGEDREGREARMSHTQRAQRAQGPSLARRTRTLLETWTPS